MLQIVQVTGHELGHAFRFLSGAFELDQQAFRQGARADPGRIERLHESERGFRCLQRTRHCLRDLGGNAAEESVLVDVADDFLGGSAHVGRAFLRVELFHEDFLQRDLLRH